MLRVWFPLIAIVAVLGAGESHAQTLINVDFGVGSKSAKTGFAATGQTTNDFWNLFRYYDPRYTPGLPLVYFREMNDLKLADGSQSGVTISVTNAPGVWGNATGDAMYDTYLFAQNGSNIVIRISHLEPGRYNFYLYGHADADASAEQNSIFKLRAAGTNYGPLTASSSAGWKASMPWVDGNQFVVFRDVTVRDSAVVIEVAPGPNGIAVVNGLQISSRGTSPPRFVENGQQQQISGPTNLVVHQIRYDGTVDDNQAKFVAELNIESFNTNEVSTVLFQGDVAVTPVNLPEGIRVSRSGRDYRLFVAKNGTYTLTLNVVAKIKRVEPWNEISFCGPSAAIASIRAQGSDGVEMQLLSGTAVEGEKSKSRIAAFLNADRLVSLRWQSKGTEVARKALVNVSSSFKATVSSTLVRLTSVFQYEMLQAPIARLRITIPKEQSLTKLEGEQIRDWKVENGVLAVEFIKPIEKNYSLTLWSEQPLTGAAQLTGPQPMDIERETGSVMVFVDDAQLDVQNTSGLRQINATDNALAAYRFYARPWDLSMRVKAVEPVVKASDRINARLEETRFVVNHSIDLHVEKAGIYSTMLSVPAGFSVIDVRGEGIEEWKVAQGKLRISFASRVLGDRKLDIQMEQPLKVFPSSLVVEPAVVTGAVKETAEIAVTASPGLRIKTAELAGLREVPISQVRGGNQVGDGLAFETEQGNWKLTMNTERLPARVTADVFNLLTIGDGIVGGSATVRYTLVNQGVQEFKVQVPAHWKNVEFTGANIRGKEKQDGETTNEMVWDISLQEKAWGGYTLVVTYDYQFDPKHALLNAAGLHVLDAEQENGSVAITTAANLKLEPKLTDTMTTTNSSGIMRTPLRQIDQSELAESDAALITRPVLLAYRYAGDDYHLQIDVTRHQEEQLLDAVADRTQITTVITEAGQMLTQASFMVKNNDRQFQRFQLPAGAEFWSCYVNGQASKAERDKDWLLVPLPRTANRNEAFAVDLVYAQKSDALHARVVPKSVEFLAPKTDVPNTYAEWEVYVPETRRVSGFGGTMTVARGTVYGLREGWTRFVDFYNDAIHENGSIVGIFAAICLGVVALVARSRTRGVTGFLEVMAALVIMAIMASMLLPALSRAKQKAQRIQAVNNLKQIGTAIRIFSGDNSAGKGPGSLDDIRNELGGSDRGVTIDPDSGERFAYVGAGKDLNNPNAILAYSPVDHFGRAVLFGDGRVEQMTSERFASALEEENRSGGRGGGANYHYSLNAASQSQAPAMAAPAEVAAEPTATDHGVQPSDATTVTATGYVEQSDWTKSVVTNGLPAKVAGIRSIRIDIPRKGQPFTFTKVLNITGDPLAVQMSVMNAGVFLVLRSGLQFAAFALGLAIVWWMKRNPTRQGAYRDAFWMALGWSLIIAAVGELAISTRVLHLILIAAAPLLILALFVWATAKVWKKSSAAPVKSFGSDAGIPPAIASIALVFFFAAMTASAETEKHPNPAVFMATITTANYSGNVGQQSAQFEGTLAISSQGTNEIVALFGPDVALQEFSVVNGEAKLMQEADAKSKVSVLIPKPGDATVKVKFLVKLGGTVSKRELTFDLPSALSSKLSANIDEPEADVEFPTAVSFTRATADQETKIEAMVGSEDRVVMQWTPRVKRAAETAATVFVENRSLATVGNGVLALRTLLNYQIAQGELRQLRAKLPEKHRLLKVEGESLRTWELKSENGEDVLVVELLKGVSPNYRLTIETERVLDTVPTTLAIAVPHALDVKRESGLVGIRATEELSVSIEQTGELQRVDVGDFSEGDQKSNALNLLTAYRFISPDFQLSIHAEPVQPHIEAVVRNFTSIDTEKVHVSARIDYTIKKAGVFDLEIGVPEHYRIESVSGENISQWKTNQTTMTISFKERVLGNYSIAIELSRSNTGAGAVEIVGVQPLSTAEAPLHKVTGFVLVSADVGIGIKALSFDGLTEVAASTIDPTANVSRAGALAYKFVNSDPTKSPSWKLQVAVEFMEAWIRAEVANIFAVSETAISGHAIVRYDIQNAPAKEFLLKIPSAFNNVEITGANIRRRDHTGEEWRVELQNKVHGTLMLNVFWDQPRDSRTNVLALTGIAAAGVERETGTVIVKAKSPLQVQEQRVSGELVKIDVRELPDWSGVNANASRDSEAAVLVYRYLRPGYTLTIDATRYDDAAVLQALIDNAHLTTVVADDGQVMTELAFAVRNNGLQHLEIELPQGDKVWSAFVGGQPVRPAIREGKLLLPLEDALNSTEESVSVELTYVGHEKFPATSGGVDLISPKVDVPLKNAHWDVYLPADYRYQDFSGSMSLQHEAAAVVRTYSLSEYRVQEAEKKQARQAYVKSVLSETKGALRGYSGKKIARYKAEDFDDEASRRELGKLQEEAQRVQSSNLINGNAQGGRDNGNASNADAYVAQQQLKKLQAAQELGATRIQPLRVNLPTRGVHYGFTQVLQTEVRKAMEVRFSAANQRAVNWFGRLFAIAGGFVALWIVAGIVVARRRDAHAA